jgi:hypothetical protein
LSPSHEVQAKSHNNDQTTGPLSPNRRQFFSCLGVLQNPAVLIS